MKIPKVVKRVGRSVSSLTRLACRRRCRWLANRLAARSGWAARLLRYPLPWAAPYRSSRLQVIRRGALGDVLMCTPGLRELKRRNPSCHVTFYTDSPELVAGLPFIDLVRPSAERPDGIISLEYEKSLPPHRHLARVIGDHLGLHVSDVRPSCVVDRGLVERYRREWSSLPRPLVVVNRRAGPWTPNKDWTPAHWETLIDRLLSRTTIIETGIGGFDGRLRSCPNYLNLVGKTSVPELVAAIAAADLHVAPDTGTIHIAAAMGIPSVVIFGGYTHPDCLAYPGNINLYSPVPCSPCWLREPCPYGKPCLHMITPTEVECALDRLWEETSSSSKSRPGRMDHTRIPIAATEVLRHVPAVPGRMLL